MILCSRIRYHNFFVLETGFFVHYGLAQSMITSLDSGWDWASMPLFEDEYSMRRIVAEKASLGKKRKGHDDVRIVGFVGEKLSAEHKNETDREYDDRVIAAIEECKASLTHPGDHAIVVAHEETLNIAANRFGVH